MIKPICHDPMLLARKAAPATFADLGVARDLRDTLAANLDRCVGMAANMIGAPKAIIVYVDGGEIHTMLNPVITKKSGEYDTEEGCLSLSGVRPCKRYQMITVEWQGTDLKKCTGTFTGFTAQIIQHEYDHLAGILI